jgi:hypothetical protein
MLIGVPYAAAQEDEGTGCYPQARSRMRTAIPEGVNDSEDWSSILPLRVELAFDPLNPDWNAEIIRYPIPIPGQEPQTWEELMLFLTGRGTVITKTIVEDDPQPEPGRIPPVGLKGNTDLRASPFDSSQIIDLLLVDDTTIEAINKDSSGEWIQIRTGRGRTGWIRADALIEGQLEQMLQLPVEGGLSFNFTATPRPPTCNLPSGLIIQTPEDMPVYLSVNSLPLELNGTAIFTMQVDPNNPDGRLMFVTLADGTLQTLDPNNAQVSESPPESFGVSLNQQGEWNAFLTSVTDTQQGGVFFAAGFTCQLYSLFGDTILKPLNCAMLGELESPFSDFINSITETAAEEATEPIELVGALREFNDAIGDIRSCTPDQLLSSVPQEGLIADLTRINLFDASRLPADNADPNEEEDSYQRTVTVTLNDLLRADYLANRENFAIIVGTHSVNGNTARYIWEGHSGSVAYIGQILDTGAIAPGTEELVEEAESGNSITYYIPDDADAFNVLLVTEVNRIPTYCDRYPETGYEQIGTVGS